MQWPTPHAIAQKCPFPEGFTLHQISENELTRVTTHLKAWYSEISVGSESCHLDPTFYHKKTFLKNGDPSHDIFPLILKQQDTPVIFFSVMRDVGALSLVGRLAVINPAYRGKKMGFTIPAFMEETARLMGAEMAYYFVTLSHPISQIGAERQGFKLCGIVPGYDRDMVAPGVTKRVYEAIYAKVLVPKEHLAFPKNEHLTENTRKLWEFLFSGEEI